MKRKTNIHFHPNFDKIIKKRNLENLLPKFDNLRHKIYELIFIKEELFPFVINKFEKEVIQEEIDIKKILNDDKSLFLMKNLVTTEGITNVITNHYFTIKEIITLFLTLLNKISPIL